VAPENAADRKTLMGDLAESLRRAGPVDAPAIAALTRAAYAKWVPILGRDPKPMAADYDEAVRNHLIDLLFVDDRLAALIEMIPQADNLLIENLAVSPAFQGSGYGRRLMAHAEQLAASLGHAEIKLYTNKLFTENLQFYRQLGYQLDREEAFKGGFIMHLSKRL
jgi:GNAT superfamily N-acetyltransferase